MSPDESRNSGLRGDDEQVPAHIKLVRIIDRTIHVSPTDRQKEVDFTVRNPTDDEFNYLFLPLRQFERNLKVYDEDGKRLNVYPNSEVEDMLEAVKEKDEEGYERLQERFKHAEYRLFIQLPPERPLNPGELRTIQLTFEQSDPVEFYDIQDPSIVTGWFRQWKKKFFKIPSFIADVKRLPGHSHDVFVVVVGTPGYATTGSSAHDGGKPAKEIYENGLDDDTRVLSVRLPSAEKDRYTWDLQYDLIPHNRGLMMTLAVYWAVAVVIGVISIALPAFGLANGLVGLGKTLSAGLVTSTIGLIFALDADWTDRYKMLSLIPLLLHGTAWVAWTLADSASILLANTDKIHIPEALYNIL